MFAFFCDGGSCGRGSSTASSLPVREEIFEEVKVWARSESFSLIYEKEERDARSGVSGRTGGSLAMVLYSKVGTFKPCSAEWSERFGTAICSIRFKVKLRRAGSRGRVGDCPGARDGAGLLQG